MTVMPGDTTDVGGVVDGDRLIVTVVEEMDEWCELTTRVTSVWKGATDVEGTVVVGKLYM